MMLQDIHALKNHGRTVGRLKYSLPSLALMALIALMSWSHLEHWMYGNKPTLAQKTLAPQANNAAIRPEYKGIDERSQPYTITADQGKEASPEKIDLTYPKMVMNLKSGDVVTLTATKGTLNKITSKMHLVGNVTLTHSLGYDLETSQAWIDCKNGSAYNNEPIWGNGPAGIIEAKGFYLAERGTKVSFLGGSQLFLMASQGN